MHDMLPRITAAHLAPLALALCATFAAPAAIAQDYPNKPVKVVVPYPPGSGLDRVARLTSERLSIALAQPFIVENKAGASGNIGAEYAFKSAPDGYTLLVTPPSPLVINQVLYPKLGYAPEEFVPVSVIASLPNVLVVSNSLPVNSLAQLLAYARANPGKLNYASQGAGTTPHLTGEMFKSMTGAKIVHVPYKGVAPALTDLIGGQVDMMFADLASALPQIRAGKLKALAVGSPVRNALLPDVPAVAESIPGFSSVLWYAMAAPPKTSPEVINKLAVAIREQMRQPAVAKILNELSMEVAPTTPAETRAFLAQEAQRWGTVVKEAKVTVDQ